jgi:hypothetical protein
MDPEDVLRILRQVGLGLLVASLFVDSAAQRLVRFRSRVAALQYRVVPDIQGPGVTLADVAIELLGATSRSR